MQFRRKLIVTRCRPRVPQQTGLTGANVGRQSSKDGKIHTQAVKVTISRQSFDKFKCVVCIEVKFKNAQCLR